MASLEKVGNKFRVTFFFAGKRYNRALHTDNPKFAAAVKQRLEDNLARIKLGSLRLPPNADLATFLLTDGQHTSPGRVAAVMNLDEFARAYLAGLPAGSLEANTLETVRLHLRHLQRWLPGILGRGVSVQALHHGHLQAYIALRAAQPGEKGRPLSPTTIRKELATFRVAWNTLAAAGQLAGPFPGRGLKYPKEADKPPFRTRAEIERLLEAGGHGLSADHHWECLYLTLAEIADLVAQVRAHASAAWVGPAVTFALHTGARRSEVVRVRRADVDFASNVVTIRERKRVKGRLTTREVPLSPFLRTELLDWLKVHPGGDMLFQHGLTVPFSVKDRSGHPPLTVDEAADHLRRTLNRTAWRVVPGWHFFRHSFISNCVGRGIDERIIDKWVGHTSAVRQRYIHLLPSVSQEAMGRVFG